MKREPDDSVKVLQLFDEYEKEAARLLEKIKERDETAALLKIAQPSKIAELRGVVSLFDDVIENTEEVLSLVAQSIEKAREADARYMKLDRSLQTAQPEFLKHFAEHHPERLEEMKAIFEDEAETAPDAKKHESH